MPIPQSSIYLDHAAATPLDPRVAEAMRPYLETEFANPSSLYAAARDARQAVEAARARVAGILGAKPTEIIFTSGGTESDNLAVQGVLRAQRHAGRSDQRHAGDSPASHPLGTDGAPAHWVTTAIEHDAILAATQALERDGYPATVVPVKPDGIVDPSAILATVTDATVLISVMYANNEVGTIQPIADLAKGVAAIRADRSRRGIRRPLYLHTDATQAANYLSLHVDRLGIDLLSVNGSKIYGPKGAGFLYVRTHTALEPLFYGGGQERTRRSGTENVPGIVGLSVALELAQSLRAAESRRLAPLRDALIRDLLAAIPDARLNGHPKHRLPNNINLTLPGAEGEALVLYLDNAGIQASTGSACSTGNLDPSHVLLALGLTSDQANASLRLTLGRTTTPEQIDRVRTSLPGIVARLRQLG